MTSTTTGNGPLEQVGTKDSGHLGAAAAVASRAPRRRKAADHCRALSNGGFAIFWSGQAI